MNQSFFKDSDEKDLEDVSRHIGWLSLYKCKGIFIHEVCIYSVRDLPDLINVHRFILNKLRLDFDPIAYQCFENWYQKRVFNLTNKDLIDRQYYVNWVKKRKKFL